MGFFQSIMMRAVAMALTANAILECRGAGAALLRGMKAAKPW